MRKFIFWAIGDWQDCVIAVICVSATVAFCMYMAAL